MTPAFAYAGAQKPNHTHPYNAHTCSRRTLVQTLFLTLPALAVSNALPVASALSKPMDQHKVAQQIRTHCSPFIKSLSLPHPQCQQLLLWRGSQFTSPSHFTRCAPASDLLDPSTYGEQGATFFLDLEQYMKQSLPPSDQVLPSRSHIATGSRSVASQWGNPVSVWPIGEFTYAHWQQSTLIYSPGQSVSQTFSTGENLVIGHHLREAILAGKEVMFEAPAFFELHEDIARQVITSLSP